MSQEEELLYVQYDCLHWLQRYNQQLKRDRRDRHMLQISPKGPSLALSYLWYEWTGSN